MRLVLDTNVVASALLWGGIPGQLLRVAQKPQTELFTSTPLLAELANILSRHKFANKVTASGFTVNQLVAHYALLAFSVRPVPMPPIARDPGDDVVIATAVAAQADIIVTEDNDLLVLHPYRNIQILSAADTIQLIST